MSLANKAPFFSVIIPLYNKEDYIDKTIESVLNQSFKNYEVIVVDDGSTDGSLKRVEAFQDLRIKVLKQKNSGVSVARNKGIEACNGTYIALIDADDLWYDDHLFELHKQITIFPEAGLYCNNYEIYYTKDYKRPANLNLSYGNQCLIVEDFFNASIANCLAWTSAVAFSKEIHLSIGGFDTTLKTFQDLDLWIRLALKYKVSFNPNITMSYHFFIGNSLSKNEYNLMRYQGLKKFKADEQVNLSLKKYLDINRYALAIRCVLNNEDAIYFKLKSEINYKNLNFKQRLLLSTPKYILKNIKVLQQFLIRKKIYITAYK